LKASQFSRNNCAEKLRHPTTRLGSVREKPGVSRSEIGHNNEKRSHFFIVTRFAVISKGDILGR
jgi:hypothetical protein